MTTQIQKPEEAAHIPQPANTLTPLDQTPDKFTIRRPARVRLSTEETRARTKAFTTEREEAFVATVREDEI
jgi:hypothetical protein